VKKFVIIVIILFVVSCIFWLIRDAVSVPGISDLQDCFVSRQWTHREILQNESGHIYTLDNEGHLIRFGIDTQHWETIKSPYIDPERWSIAKNTLACFLSHRDCEEGKISIFSMPGFELVNTIIFDTKKYWLPNLVLDRKGKYVAVLSYHRINNHPGYCMAIYNVKSGHKIFEYDYLANEGFIDWSSDSGKILFSSFKKEDISKDLSQRSMPYIYLYDLKDKTFEKVCRGYAPQWDSERERVMFCKEDSGFIYGDIFEFDRKTQEEKILIKGVRLVDYHWSPSGRNLVVAIPHKAYSLYNWPKRLTIISHDNPELRFIIKSNHNPNSDERFYWVDD
jgi:hypothetical protein